MSEENKVEGKKLELNLNDKVEANIKMSSQKNKPTNEQLQTIEKSLVTFLLDMKKTLEGARDITAKIGFQHLSLTLDTSVRDINIYLEQYKEDIKREKQKDDK